MHDEPFRIGSLFSGVEGFGVGFTLAGASVAWHSEIDSYASRVLAQRFPGVPNVGDITKADPSTLEDVDCITFGFPCQDLSVADGHGISGQARPCDCPDTPRYRCTETPSPSRSPTGSPNASATSTKD